MDDERTDEPPTTTLPLDLVPTRTGWTASQIAGVITGGVLAALTMSLLTVGLALNAGWRL
ncbi:MAG TPA: hypothetical protein VKY39_01985 [Aggregatilineales bacterium]|nr:hypothetical protein [Aggregatilineales bacterium]